MKYDESRNWAPQMRKWMGDARQHGMPVRVSRVTRSPFAGASSSTGSAKMVSRITDAGITRVTDDNMTVRVVDFSSSGAL